MSQEIRQELIALQQEFASILTIEANEALHELGQAVRQRGESARDIGR